MALVGQIQFPHPILAVCVGSLQMPHINMDDIDPTHHWDHPINSENGLW